MEDLLYALLLQSANDAAVALADHVAGSEARFVKEMNTRAATLGLRRTRFRSPNGLDDRGYSTARDLMTLTRTAMALPRFGDIVSTDVPLDPGPRGRHARDPEPERPLVAVCGRDRCEDGVHGASRVLRRRDGRARRTAIGVGRPRGARRRVLRRGGAAGLRVHGVHGSPVRDDGRPRRDRHAPGRKRRGRRRSRPRGARPDRVAGRDPQRRSSWIRRPPIPPAPGERVARLKVTLPGITVGRVPLVVSSVPPPPPIDDGPWWQRAADALTSAVGAAVDAVRG